MIKSSVWQEPGEKPHLAIQNLIMARLDISSWRESTQNTGNSKSHHGKNAVTAQLYAEKRILTAAKMQNSPRRDCDKMDSKGWLAHVKRKGAFKAHEVI